MQPFPKWVSWIFVALLAYILYLGNQSQKPPESAPSEVAETATSMPNKDYESLRQLTDGDRWYRAFNPNYIGEADIKELTVGEGDAVVCGSEVELLLRGTTKDGANFDSNHEEEKPLIFTVGAAPFEALNEGTIGMKQGGVRVLHAPAKQVYHEAEKRTLDEVTLHLTLQKVTSPNPSDMPATSVTLITGEDEKEPARCGTKMQATVTIFDVAGKRIHHTTSPITFTLGTRDVAWGVDMLARGMKQGEERLLTIPPYYLKQSASKDEALSAVRDALRSKELRIVQITRAE